MAILGITGGIGSGKSTLARMLSEELGARLIDTDAVSRELLESDPDVRSEMVAGVFSEAYTAEGKPDRAAIRAVVFRDPDKKTRLEEILHPRIRKRWTAVAGDCRARGETLLVEIPLLFETSARESFDRVVTVGCDPATQSRRIAERGLGPDEARAIIQSQTPLERKTALSDFVVWNDGSLENLRRQSRELAKRLAALA